MISNDIVPSAFPDDYNNLDEDACATLVDWLNWCQNLIDTTQNKDIANRYSLQIESVRSVMYACDVFIEYDWVGHEGKWFLATYDDAVDQQAHLQEQEFILNVNKYCTKEIYDC